MVAEQSLVVMKFGGTSVGSIERIRSVAERIKGYVEQNGPKLVVVVSAMSGETNKLVALAQEVAGGTIPEREYDQLVSSGEQVSSALLSMALGRLGVKAESLLGFQLKLVTKSVQGNNLIESIGQSRLISLVNEGAVPVVAGFQGVDEQGNITTLGRGGSDTTAVAVAALLGSCRCIIYTDVDGVYSAPPAICRKAIKKSKLTYEEMLELAGGGAKVLHRRSVSLARRYKVPLEVSLSFAEVNGTHIVEEYEGMEDAIVSGITYKSDEARVTLRNLPDLPGTAAEIFHQVSQRGVVVDMIVQNEGRDGRAEISFTVPESAADDMKVFLGSYLEHKMPDVVLDVDSDIAKLSVIGEGMRNHAGVAAEMFRVLAAEGINIELITTSEIKISVAIKRKYAELAVRALHEVFFEKG